MNAKVGMHGDKDQNKEVEASVNIKDNVEDGEDQNREERAPISTVIDGDHGVNEDKEMQISVNTEVVIIGHFEDPYEENKTPLNAGLGKDEDKEMQVSVRTSAVSDPGENKVLVNAEISTGCVADQNQDVLLPLRKVLRVSRSRQESLSASEYKRHQ